MKLLRGFSFYKGNCNRYTSSDPHNIPVWQIFSGKSSDSWESFMKAHIRRCSRHIFDRPASHRGGQPEAALLETQNWWDCHWVPPKHIQRPTKSTQQLTILAIHCDTSPWWNSAPPTHGCRGKANRRCEPHIVEFVSAQKGYRLQRCKIHGADIFLTQRIVIRIAIRHHSPPLNDGLIMAWFFSSFFTWPVARIIISLGGSPCTWLCGWRHDRMVSLCVSWNSPGWQLSHGPPLAPLISTGRHRLCINMNISFLVI